MRRPWIAVLFAGCGSLVVITLVLGGIVTYFSWHAIAPALKTASDAAEVAKNVARSVRQSDARSDTSNDDDRKLQNGTAALKSLFDGGRPQIATLSRARLRAFLPATVGTLARSSADATSGAMAGISGTNATATYGGTGNGSVDISITDAANASGVTAMASLMLNVETETDEGYEKNVDLAARASTKSGKRPQSTQSSSQ